MNNSFFSRFAPRENKFFPLLNSLAEVAVTVSEQLCVLINNKSNGEDVKQDYEKIKSEETKGDVITTKILNDLSSTFITPFDREDIHDLANYLDDVIDEINSCAKRIYLYNPQQLTKETSDITEIIKQGSIIIKNAIGYLSTLRKNSDKIGSCCEELHVLENKGDDLYADFIRNVFRDETNPTEIIKLKDIVAGLEKTTDCNDHVGKVLRTIIVKYA